MIEPKEEEEEEPIYDDRYVTLTKDELILKVFYFPLARSKTIPLDDIERIYLGTDPELGLSIWKKKTWGMAMSNVWWAYRGGREFDSNNEKNFVVSFKSSSTFRSGFSVEDTKTFKTLIEKYIPQ